MLRDFDDPLRSIQPAALLTGLEIPEPRLREQLPERSPVLWRERSLHTSRDRSRRVSAGAGELDRNELRVSHEVLNAHRDSGMEGPESEESETRARLRRGRERGLAHGTQLRGVPIADELIGRIIERAGTPVACEDRSSVYSPWCRAISASLSRRKRAALL